MQKVLLVRLVAYDLANNSTVGELQMPCVSQEGFLLAICGF